MLRGSRKELTGYMTAPQAEIGSNTTSAKPLRPSNLVSLAELIAFTVTCTQPAAVR